MAQSGYNIDVYGAFSVGFRLIRITAQAIIRAAGMMHGNSLRSYIRLICSIVNLSDQPLLSAWMQSFWSIARQRAVPEKENITAIIFAAFFLKKHNTAAADIIAAEVIKSAPMRVSFSP